MTKNSGQKETEERDSTFKEEWMLRPCKAYIEEYKDCRSIKARLHQHFVYGKSIDCSQWSRDYENCLKWEDDKNMKAAKEVIASETERRMKRLRGHYGNNVWEKRSSPPEDWDKPLPEYLQKEYENTYLQLKSRELRGETVPNVVENLNRSCTIM